jgi:hypothetical protein
VSDQVCLVTAYRQRIAEIDRQGITKYPFTPSLKYSSDNQLCEKVLNKHLNEFLESDAKSELQYMTWQTVEERKSYGDLEYVELKFNDNKSMFLAQFESCCQSSVELYKTALFPSKEVFSDLAYYTQVRDAKKIITDKGREISHK